jgi:hypothetical protein
MMTIFWSQQPKEGKTLKKREYERISSAMHFYFSSPVVVSTSLSCT